MIARFCVKCFSENLQFKAFLPDLYLAECILNLFTNFCLALGLVMLILYFANYSLFGGNARIIYLSIYHVLVD